MLVYPWYANYSDTLIEYANAEEQLLFGEGVQKCL